jgi:transposase
MRAASPRRCAGRVVVSIYIPPLAIRELREICRGRQHVVRLRTKLVQTIRARLLRQDVADPALTKLTSVAGLAWLRSVHVGGPVDAVWRRHERLLWLAQAEAQTADAVVKAAAAADPIATRLTRLRGVGPVLGLTLRAEIGSIDRFACGAALASYAGLVPHVHGSAERLRYGRITRAGSPWLRWALVEVAVHAIHRSDKIGRWARRLALQKGIQRARVALARRLCDDIVRVWRTLD